MFFLCICAFLSLINFSVSSGYFEIQITAIQNPRGEISTGECCDGLRDSSGNCTEPCETFFRVCLKEYQNFVSFEGTCTFGNVTTPVLGGNTFSYPLENTRTRLKLPFDFAWTRSYTLILEAWDRDTMAYGGRMIERAARSGVILPGQDWHTITHNGPTASLIYRIRVVCDLHYYNTTCTKFCRPRDDHFGHFSCDDNGDKVCMQGWMGTDCQKAICRTGCSHGSCDQPGECRCSYGWQGVLCDQCIPYPGCKHGSCNGSPWQCFCDVNWGGILCDKDLNFCGRHHPCQNEGICKNTAPDQYECTCLEGYSGTNCEIAEHACTSSPCYNGATCIDISGGYICSCAPGWTGPNCRGNINECSSSPCLHSGTCLDDVNKYRCICPPGWNGAHCQLDSDECSGSPCINAYSCEDLVGDYVCHCQTGWTGKNCDFNINDCHHQCQNKAQCVDLVNSYHCACLPGYTGRHCETEICECCSNPCQNGATCRDQIAGYSCECTAGYTGFNCQSNETSGGVHLISSNVCGKHGMCISKPGGSFTCACDLGFKGIYCHENINDCASSPCQNGGTCIDGINSYQCICKDGWEGALCNINKDECSPNPCRNGGVCTDLVADYMCECINGWKGKTCTLRNSQCSSTTCLNGGVCTDLGDVFTCRCPDRYEGSTCQLPAVRACDSSPCKHGATCVNSGDSFTCICKEGYEGPLCESDINDCNPFPCYNGGHCIDGLNWYLCDCAKGFAGPDCRVSKYYNEVIVNINECASSPCTYGSTCIDGIGEYKCICPPGRTGDQCQEVEGQSPSPMSCVFNRRIYPDQTTWEHECNMCTCSNGVVKCSKIWCGPKNCLSHPNVSEPIVKCTEDQTCVVQTDENCFTPPCLPWGQCKGMDKITDPAPHNLDTQCLPNQAQLSNNCAKISLIFDKSKMPVGITVEFVCDSLRKFPILRELSHIKQVYILCAVQTHNLDTVEVLVFTLDMIDRESGKLDPVLRKAVDNLTNVISHKKSNSSALSAVIEVELEISPVQYKTTLGATLLIPIVCSVIGFLGIISIAILILFHFRRKREIERQKVQAQYLEQKTNNENEENIRRYRNPLYTDKGGGTRKTSITEDIDSDKFENLEKSPHRLLTGRSDSPNDSNDWKDSSPPQKAKKKDINIEISRSRARVRAAERARMERELMEISLAVGADVGSEHEVMV
ncbi:hypothetical protein FSP39_000187 [Pinctada imbricata]|uniref:Delta-like protein n=1 Tax=Pinctada imbricata TaxID=66713 RepID=A0AA88XXN1_PINIB|nr:hypothetical protein FSP39_000187 [Pinctada imbricata]